MKKSKSYLELITLPTFEERFKYLSTDSIVGDITFGRERYLNQAFYHSAEWKRIRNQVIIRDNACDLGIDDRPIRTTVLIHHINPITAQDILNRDPVLFDLNNLICVSKDTHNSLHYGDISQTFPTKARERKPNDTCPWRQ